MVTLTVELAATVLVGAGQWVVHNADLSGIGRIQFLLSWLNPVNRQARLNNYVENLIRQSAGIQNLSHLVEQPSQWVASFQYRSTGTPRYNINKRVILMSRAHLFGSTQHQIKVASHELWHAQMHQSGLIPPPGRYRYGSPNYAFHEVAVERLSRENMIAYFGDDFSDKVRRESLQYEASWLKNCPRW